MSDAETVKFSTNIEPIEKSKKLFESNLPLKESFVDSYVLKENH